MISNANAENIARQREQIIAACAEDWVQASEIQKLLNIGPITARKRIRQMELREEVATRRMKINGRWKLQCRTIGPGYIPPLYETTLDAMPLAECFGGLTYKMPAGTGARL